MKSLSLCLLFSAFSFAAFAQSTGPEIRGKIDNFFCGNAYELTEGEPSKAYLDTCILYITRESSGEKLAIFASENAYLTSLLPFDERPPILIGRTVDLYMCEAPMGRYAPFVKLLPAKSEYKYLDCYTPLMELVIDAQDALKPSDVEGEYIGRSKYSEKTIRVTVDVLQQVVEQPTLFPSTDFEMELSYESETGAEARFPIIKSSELKLAKKERGSFFYDSFTYDCDDPDCFNADGKLRFIKNANGSYTLFLEFEYYNAHPTGKEGVGEEFSEKVFLKRVNP